MMTDCEFLLAILQDGRPHTQHELLRLSFESRGCGLTIHSRIADLRKKGHDIRCEHVPGENRGRAWAYTLREPATEGPLSGGADFSAGSRSADAQPASSAAAAEVRAVPLQLFGEAA